jgi:glycosyltransferase involved in cell wall biosynthesis
MVEKTMEKVSVVITSFNEKKYIEQALQSILNQTHPAHEIIVMDSGSTDGTLEILEKYYRGGKILLESHSDFWCYESWNRGIELSTGDWVYMLDGDDVAFPNAIENLVNAIPESKDADIIYGGWEVISADGTSLGNFLKKLENPILILGQCYWHSGALMLNKRVFKNIGVFNASLRMSGDIDFWYRMILADCKMIFIPEILKQHRRHSESLGARTKYGDEPIQVHNKYYPLFKKKFG